MSFSFPAAWVYLLQGACLALIALVCWFLRPDLRRWQLTVGLALMPLGPAGELYFLQDYWHAPFVLPFIVAGRPLGGIGDLVFGLAMGSIAAIGAAVVSGRTLAIVSGEHAAASADRLPFRPAPLKARAGIAVALLMIVGGGTFFLFTVVHLPSIIANSIALLAAAMFLTTYRRDLWWYVLLSAPVSALTLVCVDSVVSFLDPTYLAHYWFPFHGTSWLSLLILGRVPITEAIFAAAFGMAVSALYPTLVNGVLVTRRAASPPPVPSRSTPSTSGPGTRAVQQSPVSVASSPFARTGATSAPRASSGGPRPFSNAADK